MSGFSILMVDDDLTHTAKLRAVLGKMSPEELGARPEQEAEIVHVTNQKDALQAVSGSKATQFDLILLDLDYPPDPPKDPKRPWRKDPKGEYQGMKWLPELRHLQPHAAIVILTSYAHERSLEHVVEAIRDYHANEFVPKTSSSREIAGRIRVAVERMRQVESLERLEEEYHNLLRSQGSRTYAEDVDNLLAHAHAGLQRIAQALECGDSSFAKSAPEQILSQLSSLQNAFRELTQHLCVGREKLKILDVVKVVREIIRLYETPSERVRAKVVFSPSQQELWMTTLESDLRLALHEVFLNALDALSAMAKPGKQPELSIGLEQVEKGVRIRLVDNGGGFSDEAMDHCFELGFTTRDDDGKHRGIGLYVARRMADSFGGQIDIQNLEGGRAQVEFFVPDLAKKHESRNSHS